LASVGPNGAQGDNASAVLSRDAESVLFSSSASNLVAGDANGRQDVFVKDLEVGTTKLVSATAEGAQSSGYSTGTGISADGRFVVFVSDADTWLPRHEQPVGNLPQGRD
jgi:Tol biopolymer transport system component